jgi:hypothetical protein
MEDELEAPGGQRAPQELASEAQPVQRGQAEA